jgi:hypothetical protein
METAFRSPVTLDSLVTGGKMGVITGVAGVAKTKGRPKRSERDDVTVKLDRSIARKAKAVAALRGISVAEFLSEITRGPVDRAYQQTHKDLEKGGG